MTKRMEDSLWLSKKAQKAMSYQGDAKTHCSKNSYWWYSLNPRGEKWKAWKSPGTSCPYRISIDIPLMCFSQISLSPDELILLKAVIIWNALLNNLNLSDYVAKSIFISKFLECRWSIIVICHFTIIYSIRSLHSIRIWNLKRVLYLFCLPHT